MDYKYCKSMVQHLTNERMNAIWSNQYSLAAELENTIQSFERLMRMH